MVDVKTLPAREHGMTDHDAAVERDARPQLLGGDVGVEATTHLEFTLDAGRGNFNGFFQVRR
jgi:hypothetical protein